MNENIYIYDKIIGVVNMTVIEPLCGMQLKSVNQSNMNMKVKHIISAIPPVRSNLKVILKNIFKKN